jgi:hypothetical protein
VARLPCVFSNDETNVVGVKSAELGNEIESRAGLRLSRLIDQPSRFLFIINKSQLKRNILVYYTKHPSAPDVGNRMASNRPIEV